MCLAGSSLHAPPPPTHTHALLQRRLQLEHPRTLVLGRLRPVLLAAAEDLLLLPVPRNVGGRWVGGLVAVSRVAAAVA